VHDFPLIHLVDIFLKICDAVAFAHSKGILHRDLKPENIMVGSFGEVLVLDWGLAKQMASDDDTEITDDGPPMPKSDDTALGTVIGTPGYMSPEQARGENASLDVRSDVFSLGAILYQILSFHRPFEAKSTPEVLALTMKGQVTPINHWEASETLSHIPSKRIPLSLSAICSKALSVTRSGRYQDVGALRQDVEAYLTGLPTTAEEASFLRQLSLFIHRYKKQVATFGFALTIFFVFFVGYLVRLNAQKVVARNSSLDAQRKQDRAVVVQREADKEYHRFAERASVFFAQAESSFGRTDLANASKLVERSIGLDPIDLKFYPLAATIHLVNFKFDKAISTCDTALDIEPYDEYLRMLRTFSQRILEEKDKVAMATKVARFLLDNDLPIAAQILLPKLPSGSLREEIYRRVLECHGWKFDLDMASEEGVKLTLLRGSQVFELSALAGFDLDHLHISGNPQLKGTPFPATATIRNLRLDRSGITYLTSLNRQPLKSLKLRDHTIKDFADLDLCPIERLEIEVAWNERLDELSRFDLKHCHLRYMPRLVNVDFLKGMSLE
jgi:tetratricopeptide (TPR) repeat protein